MGDRRENYVKKMTRLGFKKVCVWVHASDVEAIKLVSAASRQAHGGAETANE